MVAGAGQAINILAVYHHLTLITCLILRAMRGEPGEFLAAVLPAGDVIFRVSPPLPMEVEAPVAPADQAAVAVKMELAVQALAVAAREGVTIW